MDVWHHDPVARRAAAIQYAIRDVVVPATALEAEGHEILKFNIGIRWPTRSPTPDHMIRARIGAREPGQRIRSVLRDSRAESGHRRI